VKIYMLPDKGWGQDYVVIHEQYNLSGSVPEAGIACRPGTSICLPQTAKTHISGHNTGTDDRFDRSIGAIIHHNDFELPDSLPVSMNQGFESRTDSLAAIEGRDNDADIHSGRAQYHAAAICTKPLDAGCTFLRSILADGIPVLAKDFSQS
jgi:hypothetical protein